MNTPLRARWRIAGARVVVVVAVFLTASTTAFADHPAPNYDPVERRGGEALPANVERVVGASAERIPGGLYRVDPAIGPALTTHGPDREGSLAGPGDVLELKGAVGFDIGDAERPPVCASDYYQHVLYAHLEGTVDRYVSVRPELQAQMRRMNAVLNSESLASGGPGADYKVLCDGDGEIAVGSFSSPGSSFSEIVSAARLAGYDSAQADYTVFFDGAAGSACGIASYANDESLDIANENNFGGDYSNVYTRCWFGEGPMHENGHAMGAVQYGTPNSTGSGGHCNEELDVMCYSPDGGDRNQGPAIPRCAGTVRFDCNFDDYFDSAPEPGEYLAEHWNLGSALNRFIAFGAPSAALPANPQPHPEALLARGRSQGSKRGIAGEPGAWRLFRVAIPRRTRILRLDLKSPGETDLGLYLQRGKAPTELRFRCRARGFAHLRCSVRAPLEGRWQAGVLTGDGPAGAPFVISARRTR